MLHGNPLMLRLLQRSGRQFTTTTNATHIPLHTFPRLPSPSSPTTFVSLNLHSKVRQALVATGIHTPTQIQTLAIPKVLSGAHTLVAAETGSGKTLAYLAPLLSALKTQDHRNELIRPLPSRPSLLVLLPTRHLADQVARIAKSLAHVAKLRVRCYTGGASASSIRRFKDAPYDVLISTPGGVATLRNRGGVYLSSIRCVVLDEADELLADRAGFGEQLSGLLTSLRSKDRQHVYVAATVPGDLEQVVRGWHGDLSMVRGENLHKAGDTGRVAVNFIRVNGGDEAKMDKMVEIVGNAVGRKDGTVMVFCDDGERREFGVERLLGRGIGSVHLSGEGSWEEREGRWERFREGSVVGVCSGAFGRGIDDDKISNVVLMDVPMTGGEYIHRVGRIRGKGRVYVLVGRREEARAEALFLGHVNGESISSVRPGAAWKEYKSAGRDRIASDKQVRRARKRGEARWVDERKSAMGEYRGPRRHSRR